MKLKNKIVLITGANGGIGTALVNAMLDKGVTKVYAAARSSAPPATLAQEYPDRVVPISLDITDRNSVAAAAEKCRDLDLLVNNAGVNTGTPLLGHTALENARQEMEVNYFGTLSMCRAFVSLLAARGCGAIVNVCSIIGLVNLPLNGTYCASKAAVHSLMQGMRAELTPRGIRVVGVYPGPVDTRMTAGQVMPKATPDQIATAIVAGLENGEEDIFPDPMSKFVYASLVKNPKQIEKEFAALIPA